ncbi:hypothetical protein [Pedobacter suwonensis]|uniref:hypothetical protein n=1 Tax=Pedobacter suwonensis TaxID=332999 RepID=UPI001FD3EB29|nr:hypothetical protein [Pedobacter suwonensis]
MIETLSAFWDFLKKPKLLKLSKDNKSLWRDLVWLIILDLLFAGIIMGIYYTLLHFEIIDEYVEKFDILKKLGLTVALIIACILAPLLEESLFRWHLRSKYLPIYFVCFTLALIADYFINSPFLKWPIYTFSFSYPSLYADILKEWISVKRWFFSGNRLDTSFIIQPSYLV